MKRAHNPNELTRKQAAWRLGCSVATVQRLVADGVLPERRERDARYSFVWYDLDDVLRVKKEYKPKRAPVKDAAAKRVVRENARGAQAAKAFALFSEGKTDVEVVIATEFDPALVAELREEWTLLIHPEMAKRKRQLEKTEREEREREKWDLNEQRQEKWRSWKLRMAAIESRKTGTG